MSKVSAEWDAMCSVLVIDRKKFQLCVKPGADEKDNIGKVLENGYVRTMITEWLNNLAAANKKTDQQCNKFNVENNRNDAFEIKTLDLQPISDITQERKSETKGRYVVSTKDLVPNDTIIRERAFVLVPVYGEEYVPGKSRPFCSNCASTLTKSLYDCKSCHRISYCSEQCRRQDETRRIHRYQCNGHVMGLFHDLGVSHLAMHALLAGIAERFDEIPVDFLKEIAKDASELETFGYSRVLRLSTNFSQMSEDDYLRFVLTAIMFTLYLKNHTDFPQEYFSEHVIGALLLRHIGQIVNNAHTMFGILFPSSDGVIQSIPLGHMHDHAKVAVIATALFPRIAILNHSCDPNIRNIFNGNVLTIKATRSISSSEEVFNGYCSSYKLLGTLKRRQLLKEQYGFDCDCSMCEQSESFLLNKYETYICQTENCGHPIVPSASQSKWWLDTDAPSSPLVCKKCSQPLDLGWSDNFMMLFERDVTSVQQLKYLTEDACAAYNEACKRMFEFHFYKWELASMLLKLMPLAQLEFTSNDDKLLDALIAAASDYVIGISEQIGEQSLERIEASGYWMDLLARRRAVMNGVSHTGELQSLSTTIAETVSIEARPIYAKYFNDYLF